ncbi:putative membrane protein [Arcobacter venerupis]|uniref:Membrane protein n=1 Tax=Arcobacter venerupis TaxID=1054033 RepID=A0AAE7B8A0_9BACT|nr:hypothetical protein [Arcobacter venerupis]QKF67258.1 putative membrane protein [Arcobacter venerupis]RWS50721.1 hypothetical protein CKA56_04090 [Arcobacter venerupis]
MNKTIVFWELYFWVMLTCFICILGFTVLNEDAVLVGNIYSKMYDILFLMIIIISLFGIRGYINKKKYFFKELWIFFFFLILVDATNYLFFEYNYIFLKNVNYLAFSVILFPWYFALYKYTFKMNELWGSFHNY